MQAVLLVLGAFGGLIFAQAIGRLVGLPLIYLLSAGELALAAVPVAYAYRRKDLALVGLRWPGARFVVAGALVGGSLWFLNAIVASLYVGPEDTKAIDWLLEAPLPVLVVCAAITPALGEELVFRGVLARGLATRLPLPAAAAISAAAFSGYHMNFVQLLPTFTLGLALAYIAVRARSIVPTILAHVLNNLAAVLLSRVPEATQDGFLSGHGAMGAAAVALAMTAGGLVLAGKGAA